MSRMSDATMNLPIYLGYNATTPVAPEVAAAMRPWLEAEFGNPSSSHGFGVRAAQAVAQARGPTERCYGNCSNRKNRSCVYAVEVRVLPPMEFA